MAKEILVPRLVVNAGLIPDDGITVTVSTNQDFGGITAAIFGDAIAEVLTNHPSVSEVVSVNYITENIQDVSTP